MLGPRIGVIEYGAGNISSVVQAFDYLGHDVVICSAPAQAAACSHLVLPGVGAFNQAAGALAETGFADAIRRHVDGGRPFLGICLGMQMLFDYGTEHGTHPGLGLAAGSVQPLAEAHPQVRSPNTGWMRVDLTTGSGLGEAAGEYFYFNHGYVCWPADERLVTGRTRSDGIVAVIEKANMIGVQFHPEKSHAAGLGVLRRFAALV